MKSKRILSLLLGLAMILALLPTTALATFNITSTHVTVTTPVIGQGLRTNNVKVTGTNPRSEVTNVQWSGEVDKNNKAMYDVAYTVTVTLKIKEGEDARYSDSIVVYIGTSTTQVATVEHISNTEIKATYTFPVKSLADKQAAQEAKQEEQVAALDANSMTMAQANSKAPLNNPITIVVNKDTVANSTNPSFYVRDGNQVTTLSGEVIPAGTSVGGSYSDLVLRITGVVYDMYVKETDSSKDPAFTNMPNVKEIWLSPDCDIEGFLNALPRGRRNAADNNRNHFGTYDKVVLIPASLYPNGPTYSGNSPSCHVMLYDGDVYEAAKKGVSAARDWCTNHSYTAQYIARDRWLADPTCTEGAKYYYSCAKCGKIEYNPNHTFDPPDAIGNAGPTAHSYSVKDLSDEHFVGIDANGNRVYLYACEFCGKDERYHDLHMTIEELIKNTGPATQAEYELVMSRNKEWWAEGGLYYNRALKASVGEATFGCYTVATSTYVTAKTSGWAKANVNTASEQGLIDKSLLGDDYTKAITRLQFASVAVKMTEKMLGRSITAAPASTFTDTDNAYALKAYAAGITAGTGDGSTFSPNDTLTRQQMATFLYRALQYVKANSSTRYSPYTSKLGEYSDAGQIESWAKDAMAFMNAFGLVAGVSDTTLGPNNSCPIEQAVIVALRSLDTGLLGWYQCTYDGGNYGIDTAVKYLYGDRIWITGVYTSSSGNTLYGNCIDPYGRSSHISLDKNVAPIKE